MKKLVGWIVLCLLVSVGLMVGIHWFETRTVQQKLAVLDRLREREATLSSMTVEIERYRSASARFRNLSNADIAEAKTRLKTEFNSGISQLDKLDPTDAEKNLSAKLSEKFSELMITAAKLEPQLFSRDVYQKEAMRNLHQATTELLEELSAKSAERQASIQPEIARTAERSTRLMAAGAGSVLILFLLMVVREYFLYSRPVKRLLQYVQAVSGGEPPASSKHPRLRGAYQAIGETLGRFASALETYRKERHQFIMAVAGDIRLPLVTLRNGTELLLSDEDRLDPGRRMKAMDMVRGSLFRLNKHLEDLTDLVEMDRDTIRLNEKVVDLSRMLEKLAGSVGGPHSLHPIDLTLPEVPVWTFLDPHRMERALIHLISKLTVQMPQGGRIQLSVSRSTASNFRGIEILIRDNTPGTHAYPTGPSQDVLKHWVSENGFGIALSQKILHAHGGTVTAAGLMGTSVQFSVRIPEERIATGMNSSALSLEGTRIQPMLSEHAINFGS